MANLPLEIIFEVIDQLVQPAHPLQYGYDPYVLRALKAFAFGCRALHRFTIPHIFSSMRIDSGHQMQSLAFGKRRYFSYVRSIYIDLEEVEREVADNVYTIAGNRPNKLAITSTCMHQSGDSLCEFLQAPETKLERLTLILPRGWDYHQDSTMHVRLVHFWTRLKTAISSVSAGLVEFVFPRGAECLDNVIAGPFTEHVRWRNLRRVGLPLWSPNLLKSSDSSLMECYSVILPYCGRLRQQDFPISASLRRVQLFLPNSTSGTTEPQESLMDIDMLTKRRQDPLTVALVRVSESIKATPYMMGVLARSGLLWEFSHVGDRCSSPELPEVKFIIEGTVTYVLKTFRTRRRW